MKTIVRSNKHLLALALVATLVLTAIIGLLAFSHSKAASPASLEEKKAGWYAVRSGAVDLSCNGVLQNKYGSWFVEDGRVNFGYTGWLVCEGTYYYVTSGKAEKPASLPTFAIPKTKSNTAGTNSATTAKAGNNSVNGTNSGAQASNGMKNNNSGSASNETNGSNSSGRATKAANEQTTKAPATTKAVTTKKASTTNKATTKKTTAPTKANTTASTTEPAPYSVPGSVDEYELPSI